MNIDAMGSVASAYQNVVNVHTPEVKQPVNEIKPVDAVSPIGKVNPVSDRVKDTQSQDEIYDRKTIGVSADGDIAQASNKAIEILEEQQRKDNTQDKEIDSLTAYTSQQLETLYARGKISRHDYDMEVERRDIITGKDEAAESVEANEAKANETTDKAVSDAIENVSIPVKQTADKTVNEQSEETGTKTTAGADDDNRRQVISEEIENDKEFINEMGRINEAEENITLKAEGLQEALESGRIDIMAQIFAGKAE